MNDIIAAISQWALDAGADLAQKVLAAVIIAVIGILVIRLVMTLLRKALEHSKLEKAAHSLIKTLARTVMIVLLVLILASTLGIDVTGVVALASVATLAVSLALQDLLANVIGGFTLLYTHPFGAGDYVEIAGQSGSVREVGMSYTVLTTPDNKVVSIPNSAVVSAQIVNYTVSGSRRVEVVVSASYDCDAQLVVDTLLSLVNDPRILDDPAPFAALTEYGDSNMKYTLRFWTKTDDYWDVYFKVQQAVLPAFKAAGITMTYPHINVHLDK